MDNYLISGRDQVGNYLLTTKVPNLLQIITWSSVELQSSAYNWDATDTALAAVVASGGKLAIAATPGIHTPSWVGAQMVSTIYNGATVSVPVPWDAKYVAAWTAFVQALSDRYASSSALDHVVLPIAAYKFPSTSLPIDMTALQGWKAAGYTSEALLTTIQDWNNTVSQLFPAFVIAPQPGGFPPVAGQLTSLETYSEIVAMAPIWFNAMLEADSGGPRFGVPPALTAVPVPTILQEARPWGAQVQAFLAEAEKTGASRVELYPADAELL